MRSTFDVETIESLARRLDRLAQEFTDAERRQLMALLAVAAAEVAGGAGGASGEPEVVPFDMLGGSFSDTFRPLIVTSAGGASLGVPAGGMPGGTKQSGTSGGSGGSSGTGKR